MIAASGTGVEQEPVLSQQVIPFHETVDFNPCVFLRRRFGQKMAPPHTPFANGVMDLPDHSALTPLQSPGAQGVADERSHESTTFAMA
ncbi:MAG: hypothetical protein ACJ8HF_22140 [Pseudomonas sp.]